MLIVSRLSLRHSFTGLGFCLPPGSLLALTGSSDKANGLLQLLAGQGKPDSGSISLDGHALKRGWFFNRFRSHMLYVSGTLPDSHKTVRHYLAGIARKHRGAMLLDAALHYFDLEALQHHTLNELPPAFRKRAALAVLLTSPRPVWLLEDPARDLDQDGKALLYALIANRCNQKGIVIMATSDVSGIAPVQTLDMDDFR